MKTITEIHRQFDHLINIHLINILAVLKYFGSDCFDSKNKLELNVIFTGRIFVQNIKYIYKTSTVHPAEHSNLGWIQIINAFGGSKRGASDAHPSVCPISFIYMQVSAKIIPNKNAFQ